MSKTSDLLPINNATAWERAAADLFDEWDTLDPAIRRFRSAKLLNPDPAFIPFLIAEYGLEELTPFVSDLYTLLKEGVAWQRIRGTIGAIQKGIGFVGMQGALEESLGRRIFWNSYQLHFTTLPPVDTPLLDRIQEVAGLSDPLRSKFKRGTFEYDVRAMVLDSGRLDNRLLDKDSGIRIRPDGAVWSFGRTTEINYQFSVDEQKALGFFIEPDWANDGTSWEELDLPWLSATFPWTLDAATQRRVAMLAWFLNRQYYIRLDSAAGVIGYRRARFASPVRPQANGIYGFGGERLIRSEIPTAFLVEAMTDFDDADSINATRAALVADPFLAEGVPPGKLWMAPGELLGGQVVASFTMPPTAPLPLRKTVRERLRFRLGVDILPPAPVNNATIILTPVDQPNPNPVTIMLTNASIAENAPNGTVIGLLSVANGSGTYTFTKSQDPDQKFSIVGNELRKAAGLDFESGTVHAITVSASNGVDAPTTRVFQIAVTNSLEVTLAPLTLSDTTADEDVPWSAVIGGKSDGSTITATASDGTQLTLSGLNLSGTFANAGTVNISLVETHPDGNNSPRQTVRAVTVAATVVAPTLNALTLNDTSSNEDALWSATIGGRTTGSTITATASDGTALSVSGSTVSGTFANPGNVNVTLVETLAGATNTPRQSVIAVTIVDVPEPVTLSALTLSDTSTDEDALWSAIIGGRTTGSTITATSSDGTPLTVNGSAVSGTFANPGTPSITLTETLAGATNTPRATVIGLTVVDVVEGNAPPAFQTIDYSGQRQIGGYTYNVTSALNPWNIQRATNYEGINRFEVRTNDQRSGDPNYRERAEYSGSPFAFEGNTEIWIAYPMLPVALEEPWWNTLFQFFGLPNDGNTVTVPTLKLEHRTRTPGAPITEINIAGNNDNSAREQIALWEGPPLQEGRIYNLVWAINQHASLGRLRLWMNGTLVLDEDPLPLGFGDNPLTYPKFGLYRDVLSSGDQGPEIVIFGDPEYGVGPDALANRITNPKPLPYYSTTTPLGSPLVGEVLYNPLPPAPTTIIGADWVEVEDAGATATNNPVGTLNMTGNDATTGVGAAFDYRLGGFTPGQLIDFDFEVVGNAVNFRVGDSTGDGEYLATTSYAPGLHTAVVTVGAAEVWLRFNRRTAGTGSVRNISHKPHVVEQSGNNVLTDMVFQARAKDYTSGQSIANRITTPADGSQQGAYARTPGTTTATGESTEPTFVAAAGGLPAMFTSDGGDTMQISTAVARLQSLSNGGPWSFYGLYKAPASHGTAEIFLQNGGNNSTTPGLSLRYTGTAIRLATSDGSATGNYTLQAANTALPTTGYILLVFTYNPPTKAYKCYINGLTPDETGTATAAKSAAATTPTTILFGSHGAGAGWLEDGLVNHIMTDAEVATLKAHLEAEHGITIF